MFGLDTISWTKFTAMLFLLCSIYYAAVFIRAWLNRAGRLHGNLFENGEELDFPSEGHLPVSVSSSDFPGELIPIHPVEPVALKVEYYRDNGVDEGYSIEQFMEDHLSRHPEILENIQIQQ